jgi:hypothetical protein
LVENCIHYKQSTEDAFRAIFRFSSLFPGWASISGLALFLKKNIYF